MVTMVFLEIIVIRHSHRHCEAFAGLCGFAKSRGNLIHCIIPGAIYHCSSSLCHSLVRSVIYSASPILSSCIIPVNPLRGSR